MYSDSASRPARTRPESACGRHRRSGCSRLRRSLVRSERIRASERCVAKGASRAPRRDGLRLGLAVLLELPPVSQTDDRRSTITRMAADRRQTPRAPRRAATRELAGRVPALRRRTAQAPPRDLRTTTICCSSSALSSGLSARTCRKPGRRRPRQVYSCSSAYAGSSPRSPERRSARASRLPQGCPNFRHSIHEYIGYSHHTRCGTLGNFSASPTRTPQGPIPNQVPKCHGDALPAVPQARAADPPR